MRLFYVLKCAGMYGGTSCKFPPCDYLPPCLGSALAEDG